ncbi:hypothetical protein [Embleya sp. NBC_00896]|uniref:hypothetical protein n=1 Tax=Embleya sp. NBC_00896 TaxID=2975961 RepID=UPI00386ABA20|nr:hypothetical protein OG928_00380 [Embleya sp. NBC_00896]
MPGTLSALSGSWRAWGSVGRALVVGIGRFDADGVPDSPLRLADAPAIIANVAALVVLGKAVGDTWTIHLDEGWVQDVPCGSPDRRMVCGVE